MQVLRFLASAAVIVVAAFALYRLELSKFLTNIGLGVSALAFCLALTAGIIFFLTRCFRVRE